MDPTATISRMPGAGQYSVTRSGGAASYVNGVFLPGSTSVIPVWACVQPLDGRDLDRIPEGERSKDRIRIWSVTTLQIASPGTQADIFTYQGRPYQIEQILSWGPFGKYIAVSVGG